MTAREAHPDKQDVRMHRARGRAQHKPRKRWCSFGFVVDFLTAALSVSGRVVFLIFKEKIVEIERRDKNAKGDLST